MVRSPSTSKRCACASLTARAAQSVYADMRGNVLVHVKVPALGLNATQWAVISWAQSQKERETVSDRKYIFRCALLCTLRRPAQSASCSRPCSAR